MRLFVSVDLPEALTGSIADVQATLEAADGLSLTDPTQAHLTLVFLGDVDPDRVPAIGQAIANGVDTADLDPFTVRFGGLGVFPDLEYIRVVWLGLDSGDEPLCALQAAIEARTSELGFEPDRHAFTPHVTLGRLHHAGGKEFLQQRVRAGIDSVGECWVDAVSLTESTLTEMGPRYTTVDRFPLE